MWRPGPGMLGRLQSIGRRRGEGCRRPVWRSWRPGWSSATNSSALFWRGYLDFGFWILDLGRRWSKSIVESVEGRVERSNFVVWFVGGGGAPTGRAGPGWRLPGLKPFAMIFRPFGSVAVRRRRRALADSL